MHRAAPRHAKKKPSREPRQLLHPQQKKANIKTRMQSRNELIKPEPTQPIAQPTRKPTRFANHTNLPEHCLPPTKENISRSEEDTKVTEDDWECEWGGREGGAGCSREVEMYREQIRGYVEGREEQFMVEAGYLRNHKLLSAKLRNYIVRYILRVSQRWELQRTTTFLAVHYMDLYFSRVFTFRDQFEVVAVAQTCLFIAMKYEEIYPPELKEWVDKRNIADVLRLEAQVLHALDFQLAHYTLEHFLNFHLWESVPAGSNEPPPAPTQHTLLLMDLTLFDLPMRQFRPSQLAPLLLVMGSRAKMEEEAGERLNRQMVQHAMWMVERNGPALKFLVDQKYKESTHFFS